MYSFDEYVENRSQYAEKQDLICFPISSYKALDGDHQTTIN